MTTITIDLRAPTELNVSVNRGCTGGPMTIALTDADGEALDLTGCEIRYEADTPERIVKDLDEGGIVCATPTSGQFALTILPADTAELEQTRVRRYAHACRIASGSEVHGLFTGSLVVSPGLIAEMD